MTTKTVGIPKEELAAMKKLFNSASQDPITWQEGAAGLRLIREVENLQSEIEELKEMCPASDGTLPHYCPNCDSQVP